jgi:hypothetical protein
MATTTNYGWTTPDDTALVKDGASAIRTLGSSVDTSVKALNPGTTSGDLDYYTAATTKARIAKGTAGQVFTMNSGATAPEWAAASSGALTLITTATASNTAVTLSVNDCFSATYEDYFILCDIKTSSSSSADFKLRVSATDSSTAYYSNGMDMSSASTTVTGKSQANATSFDTGDYGTNAGVKTFIVTNPFITVNTGILLNSAGGWQGTSTSQRWAQGIHQTATSYTGFTIIGQFNLTGTVRVYGYAK